MEQVLAATGTSLVAVWSSHRRLTAPGSSLRQQVSLSLSVSLCLSLTDPRWLAGGPHGFGQAATNGAGGTLVHSDVYRYSIPYYLWNMCMENLMYIYLRGVHISMYILDYLSFCIFRSIRLCSFTLLFVPFVHFTSALD